jgi:prophage maintenance system killer protein
MATTRTVESAPRGKSTETHDGRAGTGSARTPTVPAMSTNPHITIPSAIDAEDALGIWVADEPIADALLVAAEVADEGERDVALVAAATFWWVARERPLTDGNKRAALALADLVLAENDHHLGGSEEELRQLAARTAAGVVDEDWVDEQFVRLTAPGAPEEFFLEREPEVVSRLAEDEYELPQPPRTGRLLRDAWNGHFPRWRPGMKRGTREPATPT